MIQYLCVHDLSIKIETEIEYLLPLLKRDYGIFFVDKKPEIADINVSVALREGNSENNYFVTPMGNLCKIDENNIFLCINAKQDESFYRREFRKYFTAIISWRLFREKNALCFHSSCVSKDKNAVVFMGESGSGKTSLAVELGVNGYSFMSNELTFISSEDCDVNVYGMPQEINLGTGALNFFEKNYPERFCCSETTDSILNKEFTEKNKRVYSQKVFNEVDTNCRGGIIIFPEPDLYAKIPSFERVPPESVAIQLMSYFLFPSEWKFRPYIAGDFLERLEKIFIQIAKCMPAYHFRWIEDHRQNRRAIEKIIHNNKV